MIELPRAALRADEIAEVADFFSFGTNDLTQTTLGMSRDDAEGKFLTWYLEDGVLERNPFETLDQDGVGDLMRIGVERGRATKPEIKLGICGEHGGEPASVGVLPRARARLRQLLAVPRPARPARGGPGGAEGGAPRRVRGRRRLGDGMARYELLVDGERRARVGSDEEARTWLRGYRAEHEEDDPDAVHVQMRRLSCLAWLTGGALVAREAFLDDALPRAVSPDGSGPV